MKNYNKIRLIAIYGVVSLAFIGVAAYYYDQPVNRLRISKHMAPDEIIVYRLHGQDSEYSGTFVVDSERSQSYGEYGHHVLSGSDKVEFYRNWKNVALRNDEGGMCHTPPYGVDFVQNGKCVFRVSICWSCGNMGVKSRFHHSPFSGFDAGHESAQNLLLLMDGILPFERQYEAMREERLNQIRGL